MITARKLAGLPEGTRLRKILLLVRDWETGVPAGDLQYRQAVLDLLPPTLLPPDFQPDDRRSLQNLRYRLLAHLGQSAADWDLSAPGDASVTEARRWSIQAWLEDLRSPFNVGSVFRTAEAFGCSGLLLSPETPAPGQPRLDKSSMGTTESLPWQVLDLAGLEALQAAGTKVFALELGGTPLDEFEFPEAGICLLGSEELGLSPQALALADRSAGRVTIPLYGQKASLNVGVAWGILAAAWTAWLQKRLRSWE